MAFKLNHILCIDDEEDVLFVTKICLETVGGFTTTAVSNGQEGVLKAISEKPDVILLDVMMPKMDGPTTLKILRQNKSLNNVPIIFMTARVRQSELEEYLTLGANGVLAKPFNPMTLADQVIEIYQKFHGNNSF